MKFVAFLLAAPLFLSGCASPPATAARIEGRYQVRGEGWYAHEDITLRNGYFQWRYVTQGKNHPEPLTGSYSFDGTILIFHHPLMPQSKRVITQREGICLLWNLPQYNEYLSTGLMPVDVLYQTR